MSRKVNNTFQIMDGRPDIVITNYMGKQIWQDLLFTTIVIVRIPMRQLQYFALKMY